MQTMPSVEPREHPMPKEQFVQNMRDCFNVLAFGGPYTRNELMYMSMMDGSIASVPQYFSAPPFSEFDLIGYRQIFSRYDRASVSNLFHGDAGRAGKAAKMGWGKMVPNLYTEETIDADYCEYCELFASRQKYPQNSIAVSNATMGESIRDSFLTGHEMDWKLAGETKMSWATGSKQIRLLVTADGKRRCRVFPKRLAVHAHRECTLTMAIMLGAFFTNLAPGAADKYVLH